MTPTTSGPDAINNSNPINRRIIEEFRAGRGQVRGALANANLLLLTTQGARTGLSRTTPLMYLPDGDRLIVFATNGGAPTSPGWYHNLIHQPEVSVELGDERFPARAVAVDECEHDELWRRQVATEPDFAAFRQAGRTVPVVALKRVTT